jgi:hypothetical protein
MMVSPFTFYRGTATIMTADLKDTPVAGLTVQLCGDAPCRTSASSRHRNGSEAHRRDSLQALSKMTELVDGQYRMVAKPPIVVPARDLGDSYGLSAKQATTTIREQLCAYRATLPDDRRHLPERFWVVDVARKVVGVGNVGTRARIALLEGRDAEDPFFLQVKEATASVLEPDVGRSRYRQHGERVVQGQRLMQAARSPAARTRRAPAAFEREAAEHRRLAGAGRGAARGLPGVRRVPQLARDVHAARLDLRRGA